MAEIWHQAYDIISPAIVKVYEPAMKPYFTDRLEGAYGPDWFDRLFRVEDDKKTGEPRYRTRSYRHEGELIRANERSPGDALEAKDYPEPDVLNCKNGHEFVFPRGLRKLSEDMKIIKRYRDDISHPAGRQELTLRDAERALSSCKVILEAIKDDRAVNEIEKLQNRLNDLASEDAANLAEQDGGPPARRTGGGFGLTRERFYVLAPIALIAIIALLAVAFELRSGNGSLECNDIGDVALTGPDDPNRTVALGGYCTDADDDDLMFTAASSDNDIVGAAVSGDSLILTAGDGSGGRATITVTATDPDGRSATASFVVVVDDDGGEPPRGVSLTIGSAGGDATSLPYPSGGYARCGSNTWRVYWFNSTGPSKHWLYLTWREVEHRVPGWGEHMISHLRQAECDLWPDGPDWTASYDPRFD